jgi:stearoyl-CoA desaturase (delta-9 desaturase)
MNLCILAILVFGFTYVVNMFYITVLYHRGLAHGSVKLKPWVRKFTVASGNWVTGIDPKAWACMHRQHHRFSDTELDPHSPWNDGVFGLILKQLKSYQRTLIRLDRNHEAYVSVVSDLDFPIHWVNRKRVWWLPYLAQGLVAVLLAVFFHTWIIAAAYFLGMMSHPVQGWLVNSFAHKYGYQNFDNGDQSRNNTWVAWLVMGEGYQNNHHARPSSARFSVRWFEWDGGYLMCQIAAKLGWVEIAKTAH